MLNEQLIIVLGETSEVLQWPTLRKLRMSARQTRFIQHYPFNIMHYNAYLMIATSPVTILDSGWPFSLTV